MKTRFLFKVMTLFALCGFTMTSCQNEADDPLTSNDVDDTPIRTLFNSRGVDEGVVNGECVIGTIQYCGKKFGQTIAREDIINYFGDKVVRSESGGIIGIDLTSSDWDAGLNHWFNAAYPLGQTDLIKKITAGNIAACRILVNQSIHAVVLTGCDGSRFQFLYYDPVMGSENNRVNFSNVYDPRIITRK